MSHRPTFAILFLALFVNTNAFAQDQIQRVVGTPNNQCRVVNSYPEYWVDGKPFFMHSASFFYHRIPRDRWADELLRLRDMGINTVELLPNWNWHQPTEDVLDFDGHTNPRRDLKYLLRLLDLLGFKVSFRPGPYLTGEWRNGGYPDWLLHRSEYHMSEQSILEGRYPRLSALQYEKSEEAATEWLKNDTHLKYTRKWFRDVLGVVKPLLADKGGPVLSIQLDDDQAIGFDNYNGPNFWKYMETLRKYASEATGDSHIPYYIDASHMRVNAEGNSMAPEAIWNMGQDYQQHSPAGYSSLQEAAKNKFLMEIVKTQPLFPPMHIEFQAGWYLNDKDTYPRLTDPTNTLMASRVMFQNGLKGLNYFPMNDTLYPAGQEVQWVNHFYAWEAAANYAGEETARASYVRRNGRLLAGMGALLASSHFLPDAGLVYPMATYPQAAITPEEADAIASFAARVLWAGALDHYNFELVDSDYAPLDNLERYRVLLLPNLVHGKEDLKRFPHLEQYSEKAQRTIREYVEDGGTLVVFPSLPEGSLFDELLAPLGKDRLQPGDATLKFSDGTTARALGFRSVLTLPKKPRGDIKVFARDASGGIVGARFPHDKGQVVFIGADFSLWSAPRGSIPPSEEGAHAALKDYPEDIQKAARMLLSAVLKEAGNERKVYPEMETPKARDPGLYVTELVADGDSRPFERRTGERPAWAFVGVTNFSVEEPRSAEVFLTDPRATDLASPAPERSMRLPRLTLPPRESLMLPARVPLSNPFWETAPGLDPADEIYYATVELTRVNYDGTALRLEFTAPTDGEVALRLADRPQSATLDGAAVSIQDDAPRQLYIVKIPKGNSPHFIRTVEVAYPREGPRITIEPREPWLAGEARSVRLRVENSRPAPLEGDLDFVAETLYSSNNPPLAVHIPPHSAREFSFPVEIPKDSAEGQPVELEATFTEKNSPTTWSWRSRVVIHRPFEYRISPVDKFPLREDQPFPLVHPILASMVLPGEATFQVRVKNWRDHEQVVTLTATGRDLIITPASSQMVLPASGETTLKVGATPAKGSGPYRFEIRLHAGAYEVSAGIVLVAIQPGEAIAYPLDYDRDGYDDVILENQKVRLYVSPRAGGRIFGYVLKDSSANALNSVGGMRDTFTTRFEPDDQKGLPQWTRANWLGLFNRPYSFKITSTSGVKAEVKFEYLAPDIYPKGVKLERTLSLLGDANVVLASTTLTPRGIEKPQAYVLENSVSFRSFNEPSEKKWFAPGHSGEDFVPQKKTDLGVRAGTIGAVNKKTGETFALMLLTPAEKSQLVAENHSAMIRVTYPVFAAKNQAHNYRAAYYFGKESPEEIEKLFARIKAANW